ncbi:MAG: FAD-dependent oxidoreductase [Candidatus Doudnabacteria bacterium]|nr:FAD-dependent oxidoreductase [Candidatus Doudnabacteria bacterium]
MNKNLDPTIYDLVIIGSGAAGLGASVYAGRYRLNVLVIGREFGGETAKAGKIENFPGFESIDGFELMELMKKQSENLGVKVIDDEVKAIKRAEHCFEIKAGSEAYLANSIIFAMGTERRKLGLSREAELTGRGVHYCVTCDGPLFTGKTIAMVGGGDASIKGVNLAAQYAKKIYLIVRGKQVTAEPVNLEQMQKLGDKVELLLETEMKELVGEKFLEKVVLSKPHQDSTELKVDGLFVEIGAKPNVELARNLGIELDEAGYMKVDNMMRTNIDGVFAAGDTVNHFGRFKQDITAAAMGAVAATSAYEDHQIHGQLCQLHFRPVAVEAGTK